MTFMLGVLGSVMFWCISIPVNFVIGVIALRNMDPDSIRPFTENKQICCERAEATGESYAGAIFMILVFMLFWWLIILVYIAWKILCLIAPVFVSIIKKAVNVVPNVRINTKENKE